jgi:hypothetical protein
LKGGIEGPVHRRILCGYVEEGKGQGLRDKRERDKRVRD